jgi:DNA segregation ATPase FtsK/SpoIIIE-like protein
MVQLQIARNLTVNSESLFRGHSAVVGATGSGKSRHVAAKLLKECLKKQPKAPDGTPWAYVVIDTNDEYGAGFLDAYPDRVVVFSPDSTRGVPFRISSRNITIDELSVFLREVTKKDLAKSELATLYLAMDELRTKGDYTFEQIFARLYELEAYSLLPALEKIAGTSIFAPDETPLNLLARPGQASVLSIGGYSPEVQAIIVSHLLRKLFLARKNGEAPETVVFLEEASTFAPEGELAPSSEITRLIATQGRGYHLILISIFQRTSLTSKNVLSQCGCFFIGKTMNAIDRQAILRNAEKIEPEHDKVIKNLKLAEEFLVTGFIVDEPVVVRIPDQHVLVSKGGRIKPKVVEAAFKREDMADYVAKIQALESAERKRLEEALERVREERQVRAKAPIVPKETQRELDRVKRDLEQSQTRYQKAVEALREREKAADRKARERYEARIKELESEVERLARQLAIAGGSREEKPVWEHEIVKQRLKPLSEKQRDLVVFLERLGPSASEKIAPTLGISLKTVSSYVSEVNKQIHGLVAFDDRKGLYYSRLTEIFPLPKPASSEELERMRAELNDARTQLESTREGANRKSAEAAALLKERDALLQQLEAKQPQQESREVRTIMEKISKALAELVEAIKS